MKTQAFIEIAPAKTKKVCNNCFYFRLWGVATGRCILECKDKSQRQTCSKFSWK